MTLPKQKTKLQVLLEEAKTNQHTVAKITGVSKGKVSRTASC